MAPSGEREQPADDEQGMLDAERDDEPTTWDRFAGHLVEKGILRPGEVEEIRADCVATQTSLPELLLRRGRCEPAQLRQELSAFFGVDAVGPEEIPIDPVLLQHFPGDLLMRKGCIPLTLVGNSLRMAMVDPGDQETLRTLRSIVIFASIWPVVALERDIKAALQLMGVSTDAHGGGSGDTEFAGPLEQVGGLLSAGKPEETLETLAAVIAAEPASGTSGGRRLSFATVEEQQAFAAEHSGREVDWVDPAFGFARYLRGVALGDLGRLEEALVDLEQAVEWNPVSDRAHLELGWVRARLDRTEEAAAAYARAAALYEAGGKRDAGQAHRGRGYCLVALGRTDEALTTYRRSLRFDSGSEIAKDAIAGLTEPAGPTPAPAGDEVARLAAATAAGGLAWASADVADEDRSFTCSEGARTITISRRGRRYRLEIRSTGGKAADESAKIEEEQDGLLKRSRRLKPLFGVVARRTRVLER